MDNETTIGEQMDYQEDQNSFETKVGSYSTQNVSVFINHDHRESGYDEWQDPSRYYVKARRGNKMSITGSKEVTFGNCVVGVGSHSDVTVANAQSSSSPPNFGGRSFWKRVAFKRDASGNAVVSADDWGISNKNNNINDDIRRTKCARN